MQVIFSYSNNSRLLWVTFNPLQQLQLVQTSVISLFHTDNQQELIHTMDSVPPYVSQPAAQVAFWSLPLWVQTGKTSQDKRFYGCGLEFSEKFRQDGRLVRSGLVGDNLSEQLYSPWWTTPTLFTVHDYCHNCYDSCAFWVYFFFPHAI